MATTPVLGSFLLATLLFAFFPGPALLYATAQTLVRGPRGGLMAALGIHLGGYAHVLAAVLGLSALFNHLPILFAAVKLAGALYLIWLGIGILRGWPGAGDPGSKAASPRVAFVQSIIVELFNPKVALFYVAFLPQFVDPAGGLAVWLQFLILGMIVNATFSLADLIAVALASPLHRRLSALARGGGWLRWTGGGLVAALGVHLAINSR